MIIHRQLHLNNQINQEAGTALTILVSAATTVDDNPCPVLECRCEPLEVCNGVASLQSRNNPLQLAEALEGIKGLLCTDSVDGLLGRTGAVHLILV